jgi:hypothetical protein
MLRPIVVLCTFAIIGDAQSRPEPVTLRITSPVSGVVVHPGQTVDIEAMVSGPYSLIAIRESLGVIIPGERSLSSPPYRFLVQVPAMITPRRYAITAELLDTRGGRINPVVTSDTITLDVEPSAPPQKLTIKESYYPLRFPVGDGRDLYVTGTFGPDELNLNNSTLTTYKTEPPGIVSVSEGQIKGLAPGSAEVTVSHQGLQAFVAVTVVGDALRITSPPAGTVVRPGQELSVEVSTAGGPFDSAMVFLAPSMSAGGELELNSKPYWSAFTIPKSTPIGPSNLVVMGKAASVPLPVYSLPVSVDIERSDAPQSVFTPYDRFGASTWVGGPVQIKVYGKFPDNPLVDLSRSSLTTYETTSNGIVSVEKDGLIMGLAAGSTTVVIRHRNLRIAVKILVRE